MMSIEEQVKYCREAVEIYISDMEAQFQSFFWKECLTNATLEVTSAIEATKDLSDISGALEKSGEYSRALRFLLGPPLSQDQFSLACPEWTKATEKIGR